MGNFELLDPRIQRWIWDQGWETLRDAQDRAIPALIGADRDVVIAARTAAGKTEAAFLPILSNLLRDPGSITNVIYIAPIKALINDQFKRMNELCDRLDVKVTPWHGDIAWSKKAGFAKRPAGVVLITPESLEAIFVNRGPYVASIFAGTRYIVVDEMHVFLGTERGRQLQSLMHRIELAAKRKVARAGLSATLGDMAMAQQFLRPGAAAEVQLIVSKDSGNGLKVQLKGYRMGPANTRDEAIKAYQACEEAIAEHLYNAMRGENNLIFPNSRGNVEIYADLLRAYCERDQVPNAFFPHHGSLSKELREEAERTLKRGSQPASAICTSTLEVGLDIGPVKSIAQIGAPPSVASLRQRLGRSGRRKGMPAILRCYEIERTIDQRSTLSDRVRAGMVQTIAMINLLLQGWCEPPDPLALHGSTLVQQLMSVIAQRGGQTAGQLWRTLVASGPFSTIEQDDFVSLLRMMGGRDLITQDQQGTLLLGARGEHLVQKHDFYCAFQCDDDYDIIADSKVLGSAPVAAALCEGQGIIFGGRRWRVLQINEKTRQIHVCADQHGQAAQFPGTKGPVHDRVREEMLRILSTSDDIRYLDAEAAELLQEARTFAIAAQLTSRSIIAVQERCLIMTWKGDCLNNALQVILGTEDIDAVNMGFYLDAAITQQELTAMLPTLCQSDIGDPEGILAGTAIPAAEKYDWAVPASILRKSYATSKLDLAGALEFLATLRDRPEAAAPTQPAADTAT
ncbi:DEAD/DEAH box helicase [Duganella vulcania]|uniref:DEAD/DEAH box helicase n=1 Tax=Duganella vulcania TaxID=2692166 RepID=A0A845GHV9_9BURK|nr:DEAD/DEAH box helicase [Duganella vulcania]MYM92347.1 DEAD/DEAH box helicase [Duganella vulcania]